MKTMLRWIVWMFLCASRGWSATTDGPVLLTTQHVDLRVSYDPARTNLLDVLVADEDSQPPRFLDSTNAVLVVAEPSRLELPVDLPPLGGAGDPLWILPASQADGLLYLGLSGEGNPTGVFAGPFTLRLLDVRGPGPFFLWQSEVGSLNFFMNSRDGIDASDAFVQLVGGHSHASWGFGTTGVFRITFQAEARRVGESTNIVSPPREFTFHVLPLPPEPASPFRAWQDARWPGAAGTADAAAGADPDGDGWANLWEYALGTDPKSGASGAEARPRVSSVVEGGKSRIELRWETSAEATDVEYVLESSDHVNGAWAAVASEVGSAAAAGKPGRVTWVLRDARSVLPATAAFYRVGIRIKVGA